MIRSLPVSRFLLGLLSKKDHYPWFGQLEITYRCNLDCLHCYCQGSQARSRELSTSRWKKIISDISKEGCIYLTFSGGEPLVRKDFWELYVYAKSKGFLISIFTNGQAFDRKGFKILEKQPPHMVEITLNGITKKTYEKISGVKGSYEKVMATIREFKARALPLVIKTNLMQVNMAEVPRIKDFTDKLLGKPGGKYYFKYDPMIYPRLNGDITPCRQRLSFDQLKKISRQDPDIWQEYCQGMHRDVAKAAQRGDSLYPCNSWKKRFLIDPYGRLKFCEFFDKFSSDLKTTSFRRGFYEVFPQVLNQCFKTQSKCRDCRLREFCYNCPARAYLETGDEESPVKYYCQLAKKVSAQAEKSN
ncbi:MAG: radical SAM protein [Candidatus Omnitrophica bacterium]|nr:radical SAM protein [Candidatus Omnitrophota bacterium]MDD5513559.1 radical SAM protein [Candidatus Omnitrophota bacterium]